SAPSIEETEETTTYTTVTSANVSEVPSSTQETTGTTGTTGTTETTGTTGTTGTTYTTVTEEEVTSAPSIEETEETTTYTTVTSANVSEVPSSTQETTETTETKSIIGLTAGMTAISSTEVAGGVPGETVKTEVFRSEEADDSIVTKTVRTTTHTETSSAGELVTTIEVETTTTSESTNGKTSTTVATETREEMEGSSLTTTSASGAAAFTVESIAEGQENSTRDTKKFVKKGKHSEKKATAASVALHGSIDADQRQSGCVAAAWGEEVGSVSTVSAHLSKYAQALMVQRGHSFKLAFDDLTCAGKVNESSKESSDVVRGVTGYAESRTMTAVIGADRAGKAAFLGALAGEVEESKGEVFYNGNEVSAPVRRRVTGYSWFGDAHAVWHGTTTVREALSLSACLRQDASIPESCKHETVEACLELLGLVELADHHIESCSAVETRLVAIGVELAFAPTVLLLDEPTSGLDEKSAQRILRVLQQVARTGRTVVCSLGDSASSAALRTFDRLLMLSSSGETLFHGETRLVVQYLEALPGVKKMSSGKSITAWALDSMGQGSVSPHAATTTATTTKTTTSVDKARASTKKKKKYASASSMSTGSDTSNREKETRFVQLFQRSEIKRTLLTQMQRVGYVKPGPNDQTPALIAAYKTGNLTAYAASWRTQVTWLVRRVMFSYWRSLASIMTIRSGAAVTTLWERVGAIGLFLVSFLRFLWVFFVARSTEYDTFDGVNQVASLIAWSTLMLGASLAFGAIVRASRGNENACWQREQAWQAYPAMAYHVCSSLVELLFVLVITFVVAVISFTLFGFWSITESGSFLLYWLTLATFSLGQVYLGQWLVRLAPSGSIAAAAGAGINLLPLLTFVWPWRKSALSSLTWLLVPQRFALQALQALVFGTAHSCVYDGEAEGARAESELQCRELRLIPSDQHFYNNQQQVTVHSYAELEYGAERGFVVFRLVELGIFLVVFRILVIVALRKR
ncbi:hypothetical protein C6341_g14353, partial [Phytophthora cactorum]